MGAVLVRLAGLLVDDGVHDACSRPRVTHIVYCKWKLEGQHQASSRRLHADTPGGYVPSDCERTEVLELVGVDALRGSQLLPSSSQSVA